MWNNCIIEIRTVRYVSPTGPIGEEGKGSDATSTNGSAIIGVNTNNPLAPEFSFKF
jgi:hypothetical protein